MERSAIKNEILIRLDEIIPPGEDISHPVDSALNSLLDESYRQFLKECPSWILPVDVIAGANIYNTTLKTASIPVPDDFARFKMIKFSDWVNPALECITVDNPKYKLIEKGLGGGTVKPDVVLTHSILGSDATPKRYFVCYGVTNEDANAIKQYIKHDKDDGLTSLDDIAIDGLVWKSVARILQIYGNAAYKLADDRYSQFIITNARP